MCVTTGYDVFTSVSTRVHIVYLCCEQLDSYMQWNKDHNTMVSSSHRSEVFAHHTALSMPHASITKTRSPWATADISLHSQFVMYG